MLLPNQILQNYTIQNLSIFRFMTFLFVHKFIVKRYKVAISNKKHENSYISIEIPVFKTFSLLILCTMRINYVITLNKSVVSSHRCLRQI